MTDANGWVQLVAVVLGGGVISAVVQAVAARKKVGADSESTFVSTASVQRKDLLDDLHRTRLERDDANARANREATKNRHWWERADEHAAWDRRQAQRLRDAGVVDTMPPLYPPENE